ncbi:MAG: insulinase family protein [Melioribacteraceae bacterium]|nr:insulinase family protein [Melioribacteraceae bacterium]
MRYKLIAALLVLLFSFEVVAQVDRSKQPEPGPAPEIQIGDYESFTLENGLKVFVVENDKLPKVTFRLILDRDPILEGENAGYVSAAGSLLRTATKTRTKDQIDEEVDFIGASLGTSSSSIYGSCLTKHQENFVELMADVILNAEFKQEELDKVKKQMMSGLQSKKSDPKTIANDVRLAITYGEDHPYGEIMTESSVESITLEHCKNYYETFWKPNAAYMAIVGDIDKDDAEELVNKYFGAWTKNEIPTAKFKTPKAPLVTKVNVVDRPESVQSVINITYPIKLMKGSADVIPVSILNTILGGSFRSRLNQNLREKHGWTYGAGSSMESDELIGSFRASSEVKSAVTDSAVTEFLFEMKELRDNKITEKELQETKNYLTGSFSRSLESPNTIASFALNIERYNLPKDYYKNYLKQLNVVTVDDVQRVAKKYLKPNKAHILVVGNSADFADEIEKFSPGGKITYYDAFAEKYDPSVKNIPEGMNAQKVIDSYIDAIGGKEKVSAINDVKMVMKGSVQTMEMSITIWKKAPNMVKSLVEVGAMKQTTVFDGEHGKSSAMGQEKVFEGKELEEMKITSVINPELKLDEYGVKSELTGLETIDGKDAYKIVFELPTGKKTTSYFDAETFLKIKEVSTLDSPQGPITQQAVFADYKDINGVKFPSTVSQQFGPQSIQLKVELVEYNTGLEDSMFKVQ